MEYVRLEHNEAISGKKQALSITVNLLEILKRIENYKILRKKELLLKGKLKKELSSLRIGLNRIQESLPEQEKIAGIRKTKKLESKESSKESEHKKNIEAQIREIKEKLEKLK